MKFDWWIQFALSITYLILILAVVSWDKLSYYLIFIIPILFIIGALKSYKKIKNLPFYIKKSIFSWLITGILVVLSIIFTIGITRALIGYTCPDEPIHLSFPLKNGVYFISSGGSTRIINYHKTYPPECYAHDIFKLNIFGSRARGIYPRQLDKYEIYGDTLYSPCTGKVIKTVDCFPDRIPPEVGKLNEGNEIEIDYNGVKISLSHLMHGSLMVKQGDLVKEGQPIGRVGNSGRSSEPHLHIHAEKYRKGVPIKFDGRFLVRNSLVFKK